jgi:hypothetical protein
MNAAFSITARMTPTVAAAIGDGAYPTLIKLVRTALSGDERERVA